MEALDAYTSALAALSAALLMITAGLAKRQLVWRAKPVEARRRRRRHYRLMRLLHPEPNLVAGSLR